MIFWKFKEKWEGVTSFTFDFASVPSNLILLKGGKKLEADQKGKLSLRKKHFFFRNFITFGRLQRQLKKSIHFTLHSFFYSLTTPLLPKKIETIRQKKMECCAKILHYYPDPLLAKMQKDYLEKSLLQEKIVKDILKACRARENSAVNLAKRGLKNGIHPQLMIKGCSGTYLLRAPNLKKIGIFKPFDEEIMAPNNPSGNQYRGEFGSRLVRKGLIVGRGVFREVAAFIVSEFLSLSLVPSTTFASFSHFGFGGVQGMKGKKEKEKFGSFQSYVEGAILLSSLSVDDRESISIFEVQKLFIFDLIIGHLDRHFSNIMIKEGKILAIDNALSFPDREENFKCWYWKELLQLHGPLFDFLEEKVFSIDVAKLQNNLRKKAFLKYGELNLMKERIEILQMGIKNKLTCCEIANQLIKGKSLQ